MARCDYIRELRPLQGVWGQQGGGAGGVVSGNDDAGPASAAYLSSEAWVGEKMPRASWLRVPLLRAYFSRRHISLFWQEWHRNAYQHVLHRAAYCRADSNS